MEIDKIYLGDCLELMKEIPDGSVDLVVTSPPYDNLRTYGHLKEGFTFEMFKPIAKELSRILKEGGGDRPAGGNQPPFLFHAHCTH